MSSRAHCAWRSVLRFSISVPCLSQSHRTCPPTIASQHAVAADVSRSCKSCPGPLHRRERAYAGSRKRRCEQWRGKGSAMPRWPSARWCTRARLAHASALARLGTRSGGAQGLSAAPHFPLDVVGIKYRSRWSGCRTARLRRRHTRLRRSHILKTTSLTR